MNYRLFVDFIGSWEDVSDDVVRIQNVPIISRNQDGSITSKGFTFEMNSNFGESDIEDIALVKVEENGVSIFVGITSDISKIYDTERHKITVENYLAALKNKFISFDNLHTALAATTTYTASDSLGLPNVSLLEAMEVMFDEVDLTLDITTFGVANQTICNDKDVIDSGDPGTTPHDFLFSDIRLDENMLYAVNQNFAAVHTALTDADKITFFSFISWICSYLSLVLIQGDDNEFFLKHSTSEGAYSVTDDQVYSLSFKNQAARGDWFIRYPAGDPGGVRRSAYTDATEDPITSIIEIGNSDGGANLKIFNSLILLLQDQSFIPISENDLYPMVNWSGTDTGFLTVLDTITGGPTVGQRMTDFYEKSLNVKTTIIENQLTFQDVLSNEIDPRNERSIVKELS